MIASHTSTDKNLSDLFISLGRFIKSCPDFLGGKTINEMVQDIVSTTVFSTSEQRTYRLDREQSNMDVEKFRDHLLRSVRQKLEEKIEAKFRGHSHEILSRIDINASFVNFEESAVVFSVKLSMKQATLPDVAMTASLTMSTPTAPEQNEQTLNAAMKVPVLKTLFVYDKTREQAEEVMILPKNRSRYPSKKGTLDIDGQNLVLKVGKKEQKLMLLKANSVVYVFGPLVLVHTHSGLNDLHFMYLVDGQGLEPLKNEDMEGALTQYSRVSLTEGHFQGFEKIETYNTPASSITIKYKGTGDSSDDINLAAILLNLLPKEKPKSSSAMKASQAMSTPTAPKQNKQTPNAAMQAGPFVLRTFEAVANAIRNIALSQAMTVPKELIHFLLANGLPHILNFKGQELWHGRFQKELHIKTYLPINYDGLSYIQGAWYQIQQNGHLQNIVIKPDEKDREFFFFGLDDNWYVIGVGGQYLPIVMSISQSDFELLYAIAMAHFEHHKQILREGVLVGEAQQILDAVERQEARYPSFEIILSYQGWEFKVKAARKEFIVGVYLLFQSLGLSPDYTIDPKQTSPNAMTLYLENQAMTAGELRINLPDFLKTVQRFANKKNVSFKVIIKNRRMITNLWFKREPLKDIRKDVWNEIKKFGLEFSYVVQIHFESKESESPALIIEVFKHTKSAAPIPISRSIFRNTAVKTPLQNHTNAAMNAQFNDLFRELVKAGVINLNEIVEGRDKIAAQLNNIIKVLETLKADLEEMGQGMAFYIALERTSKLVATLKMSKEFKVWLEKRYTISYHEVSQYYFTIERGGFDRNIKPQEISKANNVLVKVEDDLKILLSQTPGAHNPQSPAGQDAILPSDQKQITGTKNEKDEPDKASLAKNGGIDLNQINVKRNGKTVTVQFDPAQLTQLEQGGFEGFTPVITGFQYISSPFPLLGINRPSQNPEMLAKA